VLREANASLTRSGEGDARFGRPDVFFAALREYAKGKRSFEPVSTRKGGKRRSGDEPGGIAR